MFGTRYSIAGLVTVATVSTLPQASTLRWPRLALCLMASVALHIAVLAEGPGQPPGRPGEPVFVRLVPLPEPEPKPRPPRFARKGATEDRPMASSKSVHAPRVPAAPAGQSPASGRLSVREHFPFQSVFDAYAEFPEPVQEELLSEAQRRVPRGNALAQAPQPIVPIVPRYPQEQLRRGVKGEILLEGFVSAGGAVDDVVVVHDEGKPELAAAAVQALRATPFRPAEGPGGATRSRITLRFVFNFE